jgi:hypothetical protein
MKQRPISQQAPSAKLNEDGALSDTALEQVSGGTDPAPATTQTSNVLKTRHDTVKNAISNIR